MSGRNRAMTAIAGLTALLALGSVVIAQGPGGVGFEKTIANAPFYAVRVTNFSNTFSGNSITRNDCAVVARDAAGDVYEAVSHNAAAASGGTPACSVPAERISIKNISTNTAYVINVKNSTYRQFTL